MVVALSSSLSLAEYSLLKEIFLLKQGGNGAGEPRWAGQDLLTKPSMARYQETTHILGQSEIPRGLRLGGGCGARGSWEGAGTQVSRHPCFSISMGGAA